MTTFRDAWAKDRPCSSCKHVFPGVFRGRCMHPRIAAEHPAGVETDLMRQDLQSMAEGARCGPAGMLWEQRQTRTLVAGTTVEAPLDWPDEPKEQPWSWKLDGPVVVLFLLAAVGLFSVCRWAWIGIETLKASW